MISKRAENRQAFAQALHNGDCLEEPELVRHAIDSQWRIFAGSSEVDEAVRRHPSQGAAAKAVIKVSTSGRAPKGDSSTVIELEEYR